VRFSAFVAVTAPAMLVATQIADTQVSHGLSLWLFTILNIVLIRSIYIGSISWFYSFLAAFLFLGCWVKVIVHHIFDYPYAEPIGNFGGTDDEWQTYYLLASVISFSLLAARATYIIAGQRKSVTSAWSTRIGPVTGLEWMVLVVVAVVFYAVNNILAFFVTGVDAKLALPFGLNAPLAFMALIGIAIIMSIYLARDIASRRQFRSRTAAIVLFVSAMASISMASRAAIVMQALPMLIAAVYVQASSTGRMIAALRPFLLFSIFLLVVLGVVSVYRINVFSGSSTANTELMAFFLLETALLVVDRWIGAEALMVALAEPTRSFGLMVELLQENPAIGNDGIYQILAGSKYEFLKGLTFLTLPGYFAIFALSGSLLTIFVCTFAMTLAGLFYESFLKWALYDQSITVALISAALANSVTQLSFPRLLIPFVFQLTALVLIIHFFVRGWFRCRPLAIDRDEINLSTSLPNDRNERRNRPTHL
jgi:hypothetical protein